MNLQGKVLLITGASRGIGAATAVLAAKEKVKVAVNYKKNLSGAMKIAQEITKIGSESLICQADVSDITQVKSMAQKIIDEWGRIDVLINNAGVLNSDHILNLTYEQIEETIDVNIKGLIFVTKEVIPHMVRQKDGIIVNISSRAGKRGHADYSVYSATKFAVLGFTQSIAQDLIGHNIRAYAVCPGNVATDMTGGQGMLPEKVAKRIIETTKENLNLKSGEDTEIYF